MSKKRKLTKEELKSQAKSLIKEIEEEGRIGSASYQKPSKKMYELMYDMIREKQKKNPFAMNKGKGE